MSLDYQDEMFDLATYAFNAEVTEEKRTRFNFLLNHSLNYGYFSDGKLTNQIVSTNFKVDFHGVEYELSGIGAVSSYPEYRGEGGITILRKALLKKLANQKTALAYLAPFSYPFYRKYGFEQLFEQISYRIKAENWPVIKKVEGSVQRMSWEEVRPIIEALYPKIESNQRGALIREEWWLDYVYGMQEKYKFAVYLNADKKPEGYLVYTSAWECFEMNDFGYLTKNAFQALLRFIGSHNGSSKEFSYNKGFGGENLSFLMPAPLIDMQVKPFMMGRIVDIKTFLDNYPFKAGVEEQYYLEIEDAYGEWNNGLWVLKITQDGKGKIEQLKEQSNDVDDEKLIRASIQKFTQLFMGYRAGSELHFFEELSGGKEAVRALSDRLAEGKPILEDYF